MNDPNASIDDPIYSSRIIQVYIQLIRRKYPHIDLPHLLSYSGIKPYEINDQGHWFTQRQINRFYERLVKLTGNERIAREAGRYAASPETIGAMREYMLGLVSPGRAYEMIGKATANFTRSSKYESRRIASNKVEIIVTPYPTSVEQPFQCENRKGFFEAILAAFRNKPSKIEHPECIFKGNGVCRYIISWERTFADKFRLLKNCSMLVFILFGAVAAITLPTQTSIPVMLSLCLVFLVMALISETLDKKNLLVANRNIQDSSEKLVEQIEVNYNNTLVTREIAQVVNRHTTLEDVLEGIMSILKKRLDYDRGMMMMADKNRTRLSFQAGFGYTDDQYQFLKKTSFHLDKPNSRGVFVVAFKDQKPLLVNDLNEIEGKLSLRSMEFASRMGAQAFICCPIICDNASLGVLAVDNIETKRLLVQSDMSLLMGISHVIGISIRHTAHLEAREKQLKSVLQVMVSSIDARDPVTAGHSEWVAEYSVGICDEMGLDRDYREMVRIAALLHDYGKIGVPDSLLKKAARLTASEYEYIKCHAEKTLEILEQINFEGNLRDVPGIASSHHEKIDGSGYPKGLKGEEIPLGARIIAVADHFEALTASRYYNTPMAPEKAIDMLLEGIGTFFERRIVEAFIRHYRARYIKTTGEEYGGIRLSAGI